MQVRDYQVSNFLIGAVLLTTLAGLGVATGAAGSVADMVSDTVMPGENTAQAPDTDPGSSETDQNTDTDSGQDPEDEGDPDDSAVTDSNDSSTGSTDSDNDATGSAFEQDSETGNQQDTQLEVNNISYRNTFQIGYAGVWRNGEFIQAEKLPQDAELVTGSSGEPYSQSLYKINENGNITITSPETFTDEVGQTALIDYKEGENHQLSIELFTTEDLEITVKINGETRTTQQVNTPATPGMKLEEAPARPANIELGNLETGQEYTADITFETVETDKTKTKKFSFTAE